MVIFLSSDGTIVKSVSENVGRGSTNGKIYIIAPITADSALISFKLPNGAFINEEIATATSATNAGLPYTYGVNCWYYGISASVTQYAGKVAYTIRFLLADGSVITSSAGTMNISTGTAWTLPNAPAQNVYENILGYLNILNACNNCMYGSAAPTSTTAGNISTYYFDIVSGKTYKCTAISSGSYTWTLQESRIDDINSIDNTANAAMSGAKINAQTVSEFYVKTDIAVANTRNGKLSANGRCIDDENYRTRRYTVTAGDIIYLKAEKESDGVFQFQSTNSLPGGVGSDNADVVGYTAGFAWDGMIKVPEGAVNVYVSSLASNTTNKVCSTASYVDSLNFSTSATVEKVSDLGSGSGYGFLSTGGVPTPSSTIQQAYYDLLHVVKGTTIYTVGGTHTLIGVMAYLYDENMTYVSTVGSYNPATKSIVIPSDGYVRILTKISDVNTAEGIEDEIAEQIKIIMPIFPAVDNARYSAFTSWQTEFESGGIDKNSEYASSNQARSVGKIACGKGTIIKLPDTALSFDIIRYDLFSGTYLNRTDGIMQSYVLDGDYFIRIIVRKYPSDTVSAADVTALPSKIKCVVLPCSQLSQALISGNKSLPSYYFTDSYIDNRVSEIMAHDSDTGYNGDAFFFITDTHWQNINTKRSPALMDYIKRKTGINKIHFAGDAVSNGSSSNYPKSEMKEMITANRDAFSFIDNWYGLCGNHDQNAFGNASGNLSDAECYAYIVRENENRITVIDEYTYFYDNERLKIRYLFVGCTSGATIKSVPNVLHAIAAVPDNYSLLVLSHIGLDENQSIISAFQDIVNALDAAQSHTAYTLDGTTYTFHNIDVIGVLSGHNHCDAVYTTSSGTNIVSTTTDSWDESGGLTRTGSTVNEQAFDVVQIDKANSTVYLTRIGAGTDRVIHYVSESVTAGSTLHAVSISRSGATLSISNPSSNGTYVSGYRIYANGNIVSTQTGTTFNLNSLDPGTYSVTVTAYGTDFNDSNQSNSVSYSVWSISNILTDLTTSNAAVKIGMNTAYSATLTPIAGKYLPSTITITMGGAPTVFTYNNDTGALAISSVTGDIVITASAEIEAKLNTPTIDLVGSILSWTSVTAAVIYSIRSNGVEVTSSAGNDIDLSPIITSDGTYNITVVAQAPGYRESNPSNIKIYSVDVQPVYGVSGLYASTPALVRTDNAVDKTFVINSSSGAITSDFNNLFPWNEATVETISGNKFLHLPDMWFRIGRDTNNNITDVAVSKQSNGIGDWYKVDSFYYSCYGGSKASTLLQSISGATRLHSQTRAQFRTAAAANGTGYFQEDLYHRTVLTFLWWIEWATKKSDSIMTGRISNSGTSGGSQMRPTGGTDNVTTPSGYETKYAQMRYHYIEDFIGNLWEFVDGSTGTNTSGGIQYVTADPTKFADNTMGLNASFNSPTTSGNCVAAYGWDVNNPFLCLPSATVVNGDYTAYFCDYGSTSNNIVLYCGAYWSTSYANYGLSCFHRSTASDSADAIGGRLLYKP